MCFFPLRHHHHHLLLERKLLLSAPVLFDPVLRCQLDHQREIIGELFASGSTHLLWRNRLWSALQAIK